ncbi:MAG: hypothetical protein KIT43_02455 [Bauldia sp.]|nr:hypothetical protein [Bauldia sp.]
MLRLSGVGLAAALLSGTALAQTPSNTIQADFIGYGGFELVNQFYAPDNYYHWYSAGAASRVNVPFGGHGNFELEARFDALLEGGYAYNRSALVAHLYARDPERFAVGVFGGYVAPMGYSMIAGGAEAQAIVGFAVLTGQALYAHGKLGCDGCTVTATQGRGGVELFLSPRTSYSLDGLYTRYTYYTDVFQVLSAVATITHQVGGGPLALFAEAEFDRITNSYDADAWTHTYAVRGGIRILLGPPGTTLQSIATTGPAMDTFFPTTRLSCFVGDTEILMADGTVRRIADVRVGDWVVGSGGDLNRVVEIETPLLGDRKLYAFGDAPAFVTAEHPFMTREGWKSIDPAATLEETGTFRVGTLTAADEVVTLASVVAEARPMRVAGGAGALGPIIDVQIATAYRTLGTITAHEAAPTTQVFNLRLDGNNTYFANGHLVHNK